MKTDFGTILVANRGEIALRVIRAARALGYGTVAVYSEPDAAAPHVLEADRAVALGGTRAEESYLSIPRMLEAARAGGADAVHPGYGFLAENPAFVQACEAEGLAFIGPGTVAMRMMGNKRLAKACAEAAGVPCLPGHGGTDQSDAALVAAGEALGFPLMVKAAAGGGGRGMRLVTEAAALPAALASARSEAANAFGDGELILERAVAGARHVEVQVLADALGHVVHLGERECSIQRRHQKVIEEAPSPAVTPELRERMGAAAVAVARAVEYLGAGTVEFLLDGAGAFHFLEMNTRLQVEHRVTELVTGTDLVAWQIRIAAGEPLALGQDEVALRGHAMEARLYAEDPAADFLPQSGEVLAWRPAAGEGVLVDHGVAAGMEITPHYDPLLAKLVAHGGHREEARRRLLAAVEGTALLGVTTNKSYLRAALAHPAFREGTATTAFTARDALAGQPAAGEAHAWLRALAAALLSLGPDSLDGAGPGGAAWSSPLPIPLVLEEGDTRRPVRVTRLRGNGGFRVEDGEQAGELKILAAQEGRLRILWEGVVHGCHAARKGETVYLDGGGICATFTEVPPALPGARRPEADGTVVAPMAGRILAVRAAAGQQVARGQCLAVLEAMKMEQEVTAPAAGRVEEVAVAEGDQVRARQLLLRLAPAGDRE